MSITNSINRNYGRIRIFLPIEKISTFHNIMILIKTDVKKNRNNYYYNIFYNIFLRKRFL